jgi:two-component system cell cycle response regulator DivK
MPSGKILLVEDHPLNFMLVRDLLEHAGFDVLHAATGEAALEAARTERPDLILMDVRLPDMDGLEVTRLLKAAPDTSDLPIVVLTAHAMRGDIERAQAHGCDGFITKPIDAKTFVAEVTAAMRPSRRTAG